MEKTKEKKQLSLIKVLPYFKKYKKLVFLVLLMLVLSTVFGVFLPIFSANYLAGLSSNNFYTASIFLIWYLACTLCKIPFSCGYFILYRKLSNKVIRDLTFDLSKSISNTTTEKSNHTSNGTYIERINRDVDACVSSLGETVDVAIDLISNIAFFIYIAFLNIWFFLVMFAYVLTSYFVDSAKEKKWRDDIKIVKEKREISSGAFGEQIRALRDIKYLNIKDNLINNADTKFGVALDSRYSASKTRNYISTLKGVLTTFIWVGFLFMGILFIKNGLTTLSIFLIVFSYSGKAQNLARTIAYVKEYLSEGEISADKVFEIIDKYPKESFGNKTLPKVVGDITVNNLIFKYENDEKVVLNGINAKFPHGKITAIVGKSGCGKSTLLSLLNKTYTLSENCGEILLDGININELTEHSLRDNLSIVSQSPYIFNMSIKENITLVKQDATDDEIYEVLKKAQLFDFVNQLPQKLETIVGENGIMLSGGQKQRLAIARLLIKNTNIIALDEATSSLDNENQEKIIDLFSQVKDNHTIIIVAHRLSTIVDADNIIVIDDGKIIAEGKHSRLMKTCKFYKEMYIKEEIK